MIIWFVTILNLSRVRGALGSSLVVAGNFGIVVAFAIGTYINYHATPIIAIILNGLFFAIFASYPETPQFLLKQNQILVCYFFKFYSSNYFISESLHS